MKTPGFPEQVPGPNETTPMTSKAPLPLGQTRGPPESPMQADHLPGSPKPTTWSGREPYWRRSSEAPQILPVICLEEEKM